MLMATHTLKKLAKKTFVYDAVRYYRGRKEYEGWMKAGQPAPPPAVVKRRIIRDYARRFGTHVFIETGTFYGDTVDAMSSVFAKIYSIELGRELYEKARERFAAKPHITILQGDSAKVLPEVLALIDEPCLFWLDGHYSAGNTAKGNQSTPVLDEVRHVLRHPVKNHVILIDDARELSGEGDYPTMRELQDLVAALSPSAHFSVEHDVIRITAG